MSINDKQVVVFLSFKVDADGQFVPNPKGLRRVLHSSITNPARIKRDTIGLVIAKNTDYSGELPSPLSIAFYDLRTAFTTDTHHTELTIAGGSFSESQTENLFYNPVRAAFCVGSSLFQATWLLVDNIDYDGSTHLGDSTLYGYMGGLASQEDQEKGWAHWLLQADSVFNHIETDSRFTPVNLF